MLSEAELSLDVLSDANREWFEYEIFQLLTQGFSLPRESGKTLGIT